MGSTINNIYKCRRISYWISEECAAGMESIDAWSQQMLKIKYTPHVAMRTVGLFFWWWTLEFSGAKGQLFRVNSSRVASSQQWLKFSSPQGESDFKSSCDCATCSCCLQPDRIKSNPLKVIRHLKWLLNWPMLVGWNRTQSSNGICSACFGVASPN